ncbi:MAG: VCBS repeat-containing protein [Verrucomicrobia bacterium]|nr:VCBS repeat-containing protein [Verrucomicrobiota bacterium]MBI3870875.1 VCBS repeat-containing protein [Verrucomicrobiota bacterium]
MGLTQTSARWIAISSCSFLSMTAFAASPPPAPKPAPPASANAFGFTGPEAFPLDHSIASLCSADLDGDGLIDLVVANNENAKITLLMNRTGKPAVEKPAQGVKREVNELPPDARFKVESLASEKRISALIVADLNGDGLPDIAYVGEPKPIEFVIHFNQGKLAWSAPKRWRIDDAQLTGEGLVAGDLNGDGLMDVAILAENHIAVLTQNADHAFGEPEKIPFTGTVKSIDIRDLDGDGRQDLILLNSEGANPIRFRLQNKAGQLGPELHFSGLPIRGFHAEDLDGDGKSEVISIAMTSGRATVASLRSKPASPLTGDLGQGQFQVIPLAKTSKPRRGVVWADIDGDQLADLLVAQPETGQIALYRQEKDGGLNSVRTFPSLAGITEIAVSATTPGKSAEIFLLSPDERQIGITTLNAQGRIAFPTPLPFEGKPLALAVGSLKAGLGSTLAVIVDVDDRRELVLRGPDGKIKSQKLSAQFKTNPSGIQMIDVNQDGLMDIVVLIPYEKLKILVQVPGKDFEEVDLAAPGGGSERPWATAADVDGDGVPELLLAQKNFLRAVTLTKNAAGAWGLDVKDQINGASAESRIVGCASLRGTKGSSADSLFLMDAERKSLTLSERGSNGVWQITRNIPLPFSDFQELQSVGIAAARPNSIACLGSAGVGWLALSGSVWELSELDGYETPIKDGRLNDAICGDLNHDGRKDIIFLETQKNHIDIVSFSTSNRLVPGARWQVFEERTFRSRRSDGAEPREALVADLNGDGKNDLAIIVHDRVLVYLQQ